MITRLALSLIMFAAASAVTARGQTAEAEAKLKGAVNEVLAVADGVRNRNTMAESLRPVLQKHINFATMTQRAVGPGWRQFSGAQQQNAVQLFSTLIIRTYGNKFTPGEHPVIQYQKAVSLAAGQVEVQTSMTYKGSRYSVKYRMEQSSGWRMTDVVIEGVSMIANYRSQLDAQFKKGGADAVLNSLTQSVARPQ